ncbi:MULTISPECIES: hypothetical protein [Pectobacterium]
MGRGQRGTDADRQLAAQSWLPSRPLSIDVLPGKITIRAEQGNMLA